MFSVPFWMSTIHIDKYSIFISFFKTLCILVTIISVNCTTMVPDSMQAVGFTEGDADNMFMETVPVPKLRPREVLIKVYTTALNRADTLQRRGRYAAPPGESTILGLEAAGTIANLHGECTKAGWKVGNRVMTLLAGGGYAEYVAVHEDLLMPVADGMSFKEAAAVPECWLTAYKLVHTVGNLQSGQSILIHGGGSGVGTAASQLARVAGAKIFVTAGSAVKLARAKELGAHTAINYKEQDFSKVILEVTEGKGVDLILDCIGGSYYEKNVEAIAVGGRWVIYGLMGGPNVSGDIFGKILRKRLTIIGTTLRARPIEYKAELVKNLTESVLPAFQSGQLQTVVDSEFRLENVAEAHKYMEANKNLGKIILRVRDEHDEL